MNQSDNLMLRNCIDLGIAFDNAHGRFTALLHEDTTLMDFLEICANNKIQLNAIYKGPKNDLT